MDDKKFPNFESGIKNNGVIVFSGTVSEDVRLDRMNRINRVMIIPFIVMEAILAVLITLCFVYSFYDALYALAPILVISLIYIVWVYIPNKKNRLWYEAYLTSPFTIAIRNGIITNSYFQQSRLVAGGKSVSRVKRVIDCGEWYYIIFKFGDIGNSWVCQKDLLIQGTIEDFEKLFEGKIIRK